MKDDDKRKITRLKHESKTLMRQGNMSAAIRKYNEAWKLERSNKIAALKGGGE